MTDLNDNKAEDHLAHIQVLKKDFDALAPARDSWIAKNSFYYENDINYMRFLVPRGQRILDLGCGTGDLLNHLKPSEGIGVDISPEMVKIAKSKYPRLAFIEGDVESLDEIKELNGPFDIIVLSDTIGNLFDCEASLSSLHNLCDPDTRIIISYYSHLWEPALKIAERLGKKMPQPFLNWLSEDDICNLLHLSDFEVIKTEWRQLIPRKIFGVGTIMNRYIGTLPLIRKLCLRNYIIARSLKHTRSTSPSTTIVIPCRNEKGNIEPAIKQTPSFCKNLEIIFVEGNSSDNTYEEALRVQNAYPDKNIKIMKQQGIGKGDAVRCGFEAATGDILMILDADLTVPPADLPKFYKAISTGKGEFINGTRLVYPMDGNAMRLLNFWANRTFSVIFSYLLNQRFTDTLCGTKVLSRKHYERISETRDYFGDFDPFGDFDLIFGASKLNLKTVEIPIRYRSRNYGTTQISRFSHGWLLLRMVVFAFRKLKAF